MYRLKGLLLCFILLTQSLNSLAFETDQYNLPPVSLADIGDEVTNYAAENIEKAFEKINAEILERQSCLEKKGERKTCDSVEKENARLKYLRSEAAIAKEVFRLLGDGIPPYTNSGTWMEKHEFRAQPARYKTSFGDTIFRAFPSDYLMISHTVNLYGSQFGTDKIAHFFQQGFAYYKIVERAKAKGLTEEQATRKANEWGQMTERTYYGNLISGLYSNGDLAANFAGMKFYQNLTREIKIDGKTQLPILILGDGVWKFNEPKKLRENLLKPLISNHFNEALNPSIFIKLFRFDSTVRKIVRKKSCPQWREKFPDMTSDDFAAKTEKLKLWHGENYGHRNSDRFITIADTCFSREETKEN